LNIEVIKSGNGELLFNAEFSRLLHENNIESFSDLWDIAGEPVKKKLAIRGTERVYLKSGSTRTEAYIKRYLPLPAKEYFKAITSFRPFFPDGAMHEWEAIISFHQAGIPTMKPIAAGMDKQGRSVLLTLGIQNYTRASKLLKEWLNNDEKNSDRRRLIVNIAELAGKMHAAKFAHQDFYLVHLFVLENFDVMPIDLQRVIMGRQFGRRWRIKDLGQLLYSAWDLTTLKEKIIFWQKYTDIAGKEIYKDKRLIRAVVRKAEHIRNRSIRKQNN